MIVEQAHADDRVARHAQEHRAGISAHLVAAFGKVVPQLDDPRARPVGKVVREAAALGRDGAERSGVGVDRAELAEMADEVRDELTGAVIGVLE